MLKRRLDISRSAKYRAILSLKFDHAKRFQMRGFYETQKFFVPCLDLYEKLAMNHATLRDS